MASTVWPTTKEPLKAAPSRAPHPLDPLSPQEISLAAQILKSALPTNTINFRVITLLEPPKALLAPYLDAERAGTTTPPTPPRAALVQYYRDHSPAQFRECRIDLGARCVLEDKGLPGKHSYTDAIEMQTAEKACLADEKVKRELEAMELPEEAVVCIEPWTYATDGMNDMAKRIIMCYFYMRLGTHADANHYAYPLELCAELTATGEVLGVYRLPLGEADRMTPADGTSPKFDRRKIHASSEYHPDVFDAERRTSTKPYLVAQPEGPSFRTQGNLLTWEKWRMRVGFNYREGLTIHDISFDGRSLFYRLSLSEMFVPYGDSRAPYPRKAAFDLGNNGAGINANDLQLGCDCLGHIKYFDFHHHTSAGDPVKFPNVVCCHEIDDGILWKHTNYRTGNAVVTRSRVLVLQTIITVGNYEYIFAFHFTQAAEISYEVRATGILSTSPIALGERVPYGTTVAPGVMAPYHQHLFSLRIDPALDGHANSLVLEESHPMPLDAPDNPFAVGYTTRRTPVEHEAGLDLDTSTNRTFTLINESILNPHAGLPVGYKLVPHPSQMLLAHPSSYHAARSEFGAHAVWVTRHADGELFSAGAHTMQSLGGDGVASWIAGRRAAAGVETGVRNADLVLWHTFGTTHNPRVEDWPVMPAEIMRVSLKPVNFFERNPAMDVKISAQRDNKSVLVDGEGEGEAEVCCTLEGRKESAKL